MTAAVTLQNERAVRAQLCELLRLFYAKDWVTGTGGGICAMLGPESLLMAPTGVHKERVRPQDLFVVNPRDGTIGRRPRERALRPSECQSIFCLLVAERSAGAVMHSHALSAVLAADLAHGRDGVIVEALEMLKGIRSVTNADKHAIPVIHNTAREPELVGQIRAAIQAPAFSTAFCVLVRDHGAYIWGADLWEAKRHAEVYHFLFEAVVSRTNNQNRTRSSGG